MSKRSVWNVGFFNAEGQFMLISCDDERTAWKAGAYEALFQLRHLMQSANSEETYRTYSGLVTSLTQNFREGYFKEICTVFSRWTVLEGAEVGTPAFTVEEAPVLSEEDLDHLWPGFIS